MRTVFALLHLALATAWAQPGSYLISTVAGGTPVAFPAQGATAAEVRLLLPAYAAIDATGNVYVSDNYYDRILRITPAGAVTTFAGSETGFGGDTGPATAAKFNGVEAMAFSAAGDLYVCDRRNGRVRKITRAGVITTVAGNGSATLVADGRPAVSGGVGNPKGVALDAAGNIYFSDSLNHVVRRVDTTGNITSVAGVAAKPGFSGDRGPATAAALQSPSGIALDQLGNLYIADTSNNRVRRVNAQGVIDTVAGNGIVGETGDAGAATAAQLNGPNDVAVSSDGNLFIANRSGGRVRRVRGATITTVAGSGTSRLFPSQATRFSLALPGGIALTAGGDLLVVDDGRRQVYQVNLVTDSIQPLAGATGGAAAGDDGPATLGKLLQPHGVAVDPDGNLFITDLIDNRVRRVSAAGVISTFAGTGALAQTDGFGRGADVGRPRGVAFDRNRNLYVTVSWGAGVRRITPAGNVTFVAGGASAGFSGDGGPALSARMFAPQSVAIDRQDNIYIADTANNRIRRVTPNGAINTIAGTGERAFGGDGGPAALARLSGPQGVVLDEQGNLFVADTGNHRVRRIDTSGNIATIAGTGELGSCNPAVAAAQSPLFLPSSLAFDAGKLLIVNTGPGQVCVLSEGRLTVIAGSTGGFGGDGGPATEAKLASPQGIATGPDGSIYVADTNNERIRKLELVRLTAGGVQNMASRLAGPVAPYELVSIQGIGLGPAAAVTAEVDAAGKWPKTLGGTRVLFDGVPAALLSVQERQIVAAVPAGVGDAIKLRVEYQGRLTNEVTLAGAISAPGIFVREGGAQAVAVNEEASENGESTPAPIGSVLTFNVTGLGTVDAALEDGQTVGEEAEVRPAQALEVTVGGMVAEVVSARVPAKQLPGIVAVRVRIPEGVEPGAAVALAVRAGGVASQAGVTIAVGPAL